MPLILLPQGRLHLPAESGEDAELASAFELGTAAGLLAMASRRETGSWDAGFMFWRGFVDEYLTALAHSPDGVEAAALPPVEPNPSVMAEYTLRTPAMEGGEYVSPELLAGLWRDLDAWAQADAAKTGGLKAWLRQIHPAMHLLGRVTFHLAENKRSEATPFAFMATFTHRLSASAQPLHLPLGRALQEFAGAGSVAALQSLLEPVRMASDSSLWAREQLESRRLFHHQAWTPVQAHAFHKEIPVFEAAGILVRIPDWWKNRRSARPRVTIRIGNSRGAGVGLDAMLDFEVEPTLGGEKLSGGMEVIGSQCRRPHAAAGTLGRGGSAEAPGRPRPLEGGQGAGGPGGRHVPKPVPGSPAAYAGDGAMTACGPVGGCCKDSDEGATQSLREAGPASPECAP